MSRQLLDKDILSEVIKGRDATVAERATHIHPNDSQSPAMRSLRILSPATRLEPGGTWRFGTWRIIVAWQ